MDMWPCDDHQTLRDKMRAIVAQFPDGPWLWDALYERGVLAALMPREAGGTDGSGAAIAIICEELGRACANVPVLESVLVCGRVLAQHPDFEDLAENIVAGRQRAAFAGLEMTGDRYDWRSQFTVSDDRLTGQKMLVTGGDEADWIVVPTGDALYLVARDVPGMSRRDVVMLGGLRGADLTFRDSPSVRIGAAADHRQTIARGVLGRCADALGAMEAAKALTIDAMKARMGAEAGTPGFRDDCHRLADMAVATDHARSAVMNFAAHADAEPPVQAWHAAMSKATVSEAARRVADLAIAIQGVAALSEDGQLGPVLRRLWLGEITFGERDHSLTLMTRLQRATNR